ncbi:MAG TPA: Ldh family oxidoreductase [Chthonomonadaceae bacterium]|nr:Ldh family oxidoreductase [Chthonomonadaceae bacterium]
MPESKDPPVGVVLPVKALSAWTEALLQSVGTSPDVAADVAEVLVAADLRGIASHGTARLPNYLALVEAGVLDPAARPVKERGKPALVRFDANNGWGQHAGRVAMDDAIARAAGLGAAISIVRNNNHYGIAGWYAMRAAEHGLIGVSLTNAGAMVAPTRARAPMLGTNPIAVAAPAGRFGMLVLDMATSTVPRGRIEVAARRGESIPRGWAIGPDGLAATAPDDALRGALLPLGGEEATGGYKGYGLALVVEMLTGVLGGATCGPHIMGLFSTARNSDLGQLFMAIDPTAIEEVGQFEARLEALLDDLTNAPRAANAPGPILYPGQPEAERAAFQATDGVALDQAVFESLATLAARMGLPFPSTHMLPRTGTQGAEE